MLETENIETMNEFRLLEKMEMESILQLTKPKTINQQIAQSKGLIINHKITLWNCPD